MKTGKRLAQGLVIGVFACICITCGLANPSYSQLSYSILHNFGGTGDGFQPYYGGPAVSGAALYGMTQGGGGTGASGVLYKINADGTGYQVLHTFKNDPPTGDGTSPRGSLTLSGSTLYGCCPYGGSPYIQVGGTVFKINTDGSGYQILYSFGGGTDNQCHPYAAPVVAGSTLYGTTAEKTGASTLGEIFALSTGGGVPQVLHEFGGKPNDGEQPYGSLTLVGSRLYGMTAFGGSGGISGGGAGYGVIYAVNTDGSDYQVLHHFQGLPNDGSVPYGALTLVGSKLYGMTSQGGAYGLGVIFSINLSGDGYQVVFHFPPSPISTGGPRGSLTLLGSKLYGLTSVGGPGGASGVIFRINPDGTCFEVLHGFMTAAGDGGQPLGDLAVVGSKLYGWTYGGGSNGSGIFFSCQLPQSNPAIMELLE
jgi:uncharacterized repeat protein (TIGR03803 family)